MSLFSDQIMNFNENSKKYIKARETLPTELQETFRQMADEYAFHALKLYGRQWVAYDVLAEMVRDGWRVLKTTTKK